MGDVDGFAGGTMKGAGARAGCAMSGVVGATIGVAGGMMGRAELGGAAVEALATAVREMLSRRIDGGALSALISEPWPSPRWRGVSNTDILPRTKNECLEVRLYACTLCSHGFCLSVTCQSAIYRERARVKSVSRSRMKG
jgi:hypothetical protein